MNYLTILIIATTLLSGKVSGGDWLPYRSVEGRFKVMTKGIFEEKIVKSQTALGEMEVHSFVFQPKETDDNLLYMITYYDFPEGGMHSDSTTLLKEFFDGTVEEATSSVAGVLIYQNDVTVEGFVGRQWRINYADNQALIRTRAFLVGNRYYALQTVSLTKQPLNATTEYFMESFKLL